MFKISFLWLAFILPIGFLGKAKLTQDEKESAKKGKVQVALLLDTSNSMDGLIDQTKSQLWKMVNKLALAKKEGEYTELEIALFEYGNDHLAMGEGYVRMVNSLTTDLDGLSEKLFQLKTHGGSEYCGWAIGDAVHNLAWSTNDKDLKIIIIAGNEPFDQGPRNFRESCQAAKKKDIIINTVHCGGWQQGIKEHWKDGADIANGQYLNIEQDRKVIHIRTPWDSRIIELNERLNKTYLGYGREGKAMKSRQMTQDANAAKYGESNVAQRATFKAKSQYKNESWDLVDAEAAKKADVTQMKTEDLPEELQKIEPAQRKVYLEKLKKERAEIQSEMLELEKKIRLYSEEERKKQGDDLTLDKVMEKTVTEQAIQKGFSFDKQ